MAHNGRDAKLNPRVFFDISIGGQKMGRIVMSLRAVSYTHLTLPTILLV